MKRPLPWFVAIGCAGAAIVALCWGWQMRCERNEAWKQQAMMAERVKGKR